MSGTNVELNFSGYWLEGGKKNVPDTSGIYCVYTATHNTVEDTVSINQLIYIGEASDVRSRLANHNKQSSWNNKREKGEILCYSVATVPAGKSDRQRAEAALINYCYNVLNIKTLNDEYTCVYDSNNKFPFPTTIVNTSGNNQSLPTTCKVVKQ